MTPALCLLAASAAGTLLVLSPAGGQQAELERTAARAIAFVETADPSALDRFRARYRISIDEPPLESLEVWTPYRRAVETAAGELRAGKLRPATVEVVRAIGPLASRTTLVLNLRFFPQNVLVRVPDYSIVLYERPAGTRVEALETKRVPGSILGDPVPPGTPILRGRVEASFDMRGLDANAVLLAGVFLDGREIRRVPVDLRSLE